MLDERQDRTGLGRRRRIYDAISENPGLHLRELQRRLGISLGDLRYHVDCLSRGGLIISKEDGYRKAFFAVSLFSYPDTTLLSLLRLDATRSILLMLLEHGEMDFRSIRELRRISKSTLSFHLRKLVDASLVVVSQSEGHKRYCLSDPERVARLLIQYKSSFLDEAVDRAVSAWMP